MLRLRRAKKVIPEHEEYVSKRYEDTAVRIYQDLKRGRGHYSSYVPWIQAMLTQYGPDERWKSKYWMEQVPQALQQQLSPSRTARGAEWREFVVHEMKDKGRGIRGIDEEREGRDEEGGGGGRLRKNAYLATAANQSQPVSKPSPVRIAWKEEEVRREKEGKTDIGMGDHAPATTNQKQLIVSNPVLILSLSTHENTNERTARHTMTTAGRSHFCTML